MQLLQCYDDYYDGGDDCISDDDDDGDEMMMIIIIINLAKDALCKDLKYILLVADLGVYRISGTPDNPAPDRRFFKNPVPAGFFSQNPAIYRIFLNFI